MEKGGKYENVIIASLVSIPIYINPLLSERPKLCKRVNVFVFFLFTKRPREKSGARWIP